jgi:hypothetical protein
LSEIANRKASVFEGKNLASVVEIADFCAGLPVCRPPGFEI